MKKIKFNKILINILIFILSISCGLLSLYLMIGEVNNIFMIITFLGTFLCSFYYLNNNFNKIIKLMLENKVFTIILLFISIIIFYELRISYRNIIVFNLNEIYYFSFLGLFIFIIIVSFMIRDWLSKFVKQMDNFEKWAYITTSIIVFGLLLFMYSNKVNFYHEYNVVYSIDSGEVYDKYLPDPHYYDVRHPLTSILTFPIYAIVNFLCSESIKPIILQFINVQLLIFIGLELKRITKNKWVYIFYILSFSSITYILFLEKYILSVFLMVTYIYNVLIDKKDSNCLLIFSIGTLPTNLYIIITEFCKKIDLTKKGENLIKILVLSLITIILTGRIPFIKTVFSDIALNSANYSAEDYTILNKFNSTSKMIESTFIALPSSEHEITSLAGIDYKAWIWDDVTENISYVGLLIIMFIIIGIIDIIRKKKYVYYPFISSFVFSFVLFMIIGWDIHESPLFAICFSFAIIPLFIYALEMLFKKFKLNIKYNKYVYLFLLLIMTIINIPEIINIYNYIK